MREKIRTKSFWMSLAAGIVLVLQTLGVRVDVPYLNEILEAVCTLLMLLGVFTAPAAFGKTEPTQPVEQTDDPPHGEGSDKESP